MQARHKRALIWTLVVGALLGIPVGYFAWQLHQSRDWLNAPKDPVSSFYYRDSDSGFWTKEKLFRSMTIVIYLPKCESNECSLVADRAAGLMNWINERLTMRYSEESNPLHRLVVGWPKEKPIASNWHRLIVEDENKLELLPMKTPKDKPWFVVIGPDAHFIGLHSLGDGFELKQVERVLSRTVMEQYLSNYLARRTFMGPRRSD
jgi:hypothetical protein